ncbi:MAG TPA: MoaD/ThiS family protein [Methanomassiliicoccales archaeon]|nr:MoaD/ThiS family protein [Methanomassiliicoccales archaeon]
MITVCVTLAGKERKVEMAKDKTIEDLFAKLELFPDAYIAIIGERPVPLTQILHDGDRLRILKVASGG